MGTSLLLTYALSSSIENEYSSTDKSFFIYSATVNFSNFSRKVPILGVILKLFLLFFNVVKNLAHLQAKISLVGVKLVNVPNVRWLCFQVILFFQFLKLISYLLNTINISVRLNSKPPLFPPEIKPQLNRVKFIAAMS